MDTNLDLRKWINFPADKNIFVEFSKRPDPSAYFVDFCIARPAWLDVAPTLTSSI